MKLHINCLIFLDVYISGMSKIIELIYGKHRPRADIVMIIFLPVTFMTYFMTHNYGLCSPVTTGR